MVLESLHHRRKKVRTPVEQEIVLFASFALIITNLKVAKLALYSNWKVLVAIFGLLLGKLGMETGQHKILKQCLIIS